MPHPMDKDNTGGHPLDRSQITPTVLPGATPAQVPDQAAVDAAAEVNAIAPEAPPLDAADLVPPPAPTAPPTGQPTLIALIEYLLELGQGLAPTISGVINTLVEGFGHVADVLNPANGRELERETELANLFAAKDVAGLEAFYNDQPPHPNKSRAICATYLKLLGHPVS